MTIQNKSLFTKQNTFLTYLSWRFFDIFAVLNYRIMKSKKLLPVRYGGGIGNNCNASVSVGHL
ncbi:hypothetical protein SAMN05444388_1054 [Flavobacterium johnsoniae]|uniref:Uncharacterized protein n=1 Tax=Flavobacterium johnsoniae TaxID=986 RepID=A0A1M5NH38_FLAJO|nr:hypothetical protein SAMN05444388_1054 [Flavobacterium johnsoniae]